MLGLITDARAHALRERYQALEREANVFVAELLMPEPAHLYNRDLVEEQPA
jgi:Zn-dependent peptidase ImmA (M78 family)